MKIYFFPIIILLNVVSFSVNANVFDTFNELNSETPGCAVGVVKKDKLVYEKYFGQANLRYQVPIDKKTVFNVGSITKHFTAAIAHKLEKQGLLSLSDSLKKYYPQGPSWFSDIKLHHLINHQSGLPDYLNDNKTRTEVVKKLSSLHYILGGLVIGQPITRDVAHSKVLEVIMALSGPIFKPGEKAQYSNTGYILLSDILEKVSGISFSDLAQQKIFKPLGMTSTQFMSLHSIEIPWSASGYNTIDASTHKYRLKSANLITQGAGGLLSTLHDFSTWVSHLINPKEDKNFWQLFLNPDLFSPALGDLPVINDQSYSNDLFINQTLAPQISTLKIGGRAYSNGLFRRRINGETVYSHGGYSIDSMRSYFWVSPEHNIGYIQLCNFNFNKRPTVKEILGLFNN